MIKRIAAVLAIVAVGIFGMAAPASAATGAMQGGCTDTYYSGEHATVTFSYTGRDALHQGYVYSTYVSWQDPYGAQMYIDLYSGNTLIASASSRTSSHVTFSNTDITYSQANVRVEWYHNAPFTCYVTT